MGSDEVNDFENWREPETIALLSTLVGVRRPNYPQNPRFPYDLGRCSKFRYFVFSNS